jgi:hypothetical protein
MSDGRYVDPQLGALAGEGAGQQVRAAEERLQEIATEAWDRVPSEQDLRDAPTYYDRPVLKHPVWKWYIPAYFVAGGVAGAAAVLGAAAQAFGGAPMRPLVRRSRWIAAAGSAAGTAFLVADLGRPERFLNMLRVFRPTSPMSVGSWILAPFAGAAAASLLPGPLGDLAGYGAGALGIPMAGYTALLTSNTAVPIWQATNRSLPALYVSSAAAGAAGFLHGRALEPGPRRAATTFGLVANAAELVAGEAVRREASAVERVGRPLEDGVSGTLWKAAKACTIAALALSVLPRTRRFSAALGLAGSIATKFAIFRAGIASARDPRATFDQQREGNK